MGRFFDILGGFPIYRSSQVLIDLWKKAGEVEIVWACCTGGHQVSV
jgi:hypothetical protein